MQENIFQAHIHRLDRKQSPTTLDDCLCNLPSGIDINRALYYQVIALFSYSFHAVNSLQAFNNLVLRAFYFKTQTLGALNYRR